MTASLKPLTLGRRPQVITQEAGQDHNCVNHHVLTDASAIERRDARGIKRELQHCYSKEDDNDEDSELLHHRTPPCPGQRSSHEPPYLVYYARDLRISHRVLT